MQASHIQVLRDCTRVRSISNFRNWSEKLTTTTTKNGMKKEKKNTTTIVEKRNEKVSKPWVDSRILRLRETLKCIVYRSAVYRSSVQCAQAVLHNYKSLIYSRSSSSCSSGGGGSSIGNNNLKLAKDRYSLCPTTTQYLLFFSLLFPHPFHISIIRFWILFLAISPALSNRKLRSI